jgi:hypothetical protein
MPVLKSLVASAFAALIVLPVHAQQTVARPRVAAPPAPQVRLQQPAALPTPGRTQPQPGALAAPQGWTQSRPAGVAPTQPQGWTQARTAPPTAMPTAIPTAIPPSPQTGPYGLATPGAAAAPSPLARYESSAHREPAGMQRIDEARREPAGASASYRQTAPRNMEEWQRQGRMTSVLDRVSPSGRASLR